MKLAFFKGKGGFISRFIRRRTNGKYSHVELVFPDGISFSSNEFEGGVRFKDIDYFAEANDWDLVPVDGIDSKKLRVWCGSKVGKKYDWGNYDVVNGSVRWQSAEVPTGLSDYPNSVPASQILPNSFYLAARPSWFRTVTWPPIGPDVSGGNIANTGGYANRIPAQECYTSVMGGPADGSGAVLSFNANTCYGATYHNPTKPACGKGTSLFCK